jgi:hypothetical protein
MLSLTNRGGSKVRAIEASNDWPVEKLRKSLGRG